MTENVVSFKENLPITVAYVLFAFAALKFSTAIYESYLCNINTPRYLNSFRARAGASHSSPLGKYFQCLLIAANRNVHL